MSKVTGERKKELIKVKLAGILNKSSSNPAFEGVTIVDVKLSPDSSSALVFYAVYGSEKDPAVITDALNAASGFFQSNSQKPSAQEILLNSPLCSIKDLITQIVSINYSPKQKNRSLFKPRQLMQPGSGHLSLHTCII